MTNRVKPYFPVVSYIIIDVILWRLDELWSNKSIYDQTDIFYITMGVRFILLFGIIILLATDKYRFEKHSMKLFIAYAIFAMVRYGMFVLDQI